MVADAPELLDRLQGEQFFRPGGVARCQRQDAPESGPFPGGPLRGFGQRFGRSHPDADGEPGAGLNVRAQLRPERFIADGRFQPPQIEKHLVDGVLLNAWHHLLEAGHDPVTHTRVYVEWKIYRNVLRI